MKMSESFFLTRRENPNGEYTDASKLLIKSGMIIKNDGGIYSYLPIGLKVIENIKKVIRDELLKVKSEELLLPTLIKDDNKEEDALEEVYHIVDRNNNKMKLAHSSLELFSELVKHKVNSYKDLHFFLHQINNKYRDEKKFEHGLVRMREFLECECYSFDSDEGGLDVSYDKMFITFKNIFSALSLNPMVVRGNDGFFSEEFQVILKNGSNTIVKCTNCGYTSNILDATSKTIINRIEVQNRKLELVKTDDNYLVKDLSNFFNVFENNILKSIIIKVNGIYKMVLLRGNSELNIKKLMRFFNTLNVEIPSIEDLKRLSIAVNNIGPVNCAMEIIADNEVKNMHNFICGSNKENYHYKNVNIIRDFKVNRYGDLKLFNKDSLCPLCRSKCEIMYGIAIGQITKLNKNDSQKYDITYTDEINHKGYSLIGSYHIGIDRCLNAIVEENHDEHGIIWPIDIAPYKVAIVIANMNHEKMIIEAEKIYNKLTSNGIETILDDRKDGIGVKLNDIELIGIPIIIAIGNNIDRGIIEVKLRNKNEFKEINIDDIYNYIDDVLANYYKK